ncbi:MAG: CopD family protein [Rhizobiales bacterium]|nr:CopD family protein [Hyphomicrobiales bacterium]
MGYFWLKAFHVAAIVTWTGGMLINALALSLLAARPQPHGVSDAGLLAAVRRWDRIVTTSAMGLAWILGLAMAVWAGWFAAPWFLLKLAIVTGLTALHGMQGGALRRMAGENGSPPPAFLGLSAPLTLGAVVLIAVLVVVKPF